MSEASAPPSVAGNALGLTEHPLRQRLNDELHARPPIRLDGPAWVSHLVMLHDLGDGRVDAATESAHLDALSAMPPATRRDTLGSELRAASAAPSSHAAPLAQAPTDAQHRIIEFGSLRIKWERHNEFSNYTFFLPRQASDASDSSALAALPEAWRRAIPGRLLAATHVEYCDGQHRSDEQALSEYEAAAESGIATRVSDDGALVLCDFRLHEGATRYVVIGRDMRPRQAGRTVQRLLEIETYRMMALIALPLAKEVGAFVARAEHELSALTSRLVDTRTAADERALLAELTRLSAQVERSISETGFRFGAAEAYYAIVQRRIADLREKRIAAFPAMQSFMERRLGPAVHTCLAVARRQTELSIRIARQNSLLRTRVDVELERQNQELLTDMNRRSRLQLRLQETVEGLSIVAITYYASQLVHYLVKGAKPILPGVSPELATALAIPVIAVAVAWSLHRMRRRMAAEEAGESTPR